MGFIQSTHELISGSIPYAERRSWYLTLIQIRSLEEAPEPANLAK